jgi:hypothetical protein
VCTSITGTRPLGGADAITFHLADPHSRAVTVSFVAAGVAALIVSGDESGPRVARACTTVVPPSHWQPVLGSFADLVLYTILSL